MIQYYWGQPLIIIAYLHCVCILYSVGQFGEVLLGDPTVSSDDKRLNQRVLDCRPMLHVLYDRDSQSNSDAGIGGAVVLAHPVGDQFGTMI